MRLGQNSQKSMVHSEQASGDSLNFPCVFKSSSPEFGFKMARYEEGICFQLVKQS